MRLAAAIGDRDVNASMSILDMLYNDGRDMTALINELGALMRDMIIFELSPKSDLIAPGRDRNMLKMLSLKFSSDRLFFNLELIRDAVYNLSRSGAIRLTTEMCILRMCDERLSDDIPALLSRVTKLEQQETMGLNRMEVIQKPNLEPVQNSIAEPAIELMVKPEIEAEPTIEPVVKPVIETEALITQDDSRKDLEETTVHEEVLASVEYPISEEASTSEVAPTPEDASTSKDASTSEEIETVKVNENADFCSYMLNFFVR
jgi:DNA polymerase III gamma/tau subunit